MQVTKKSNTESSFPFSPITNLSFCLLSYLKKYLFYYAVHARIYQLKQNNNNNNNLVPRGQTLYYHAKIIPPSPQKGVGGGEVVSGLWTVYVEEGEKWPSLLPFTNHGWSSLGQSDFGNKNIYHFCRYRRFTYLGSFAMNGPYLDKTKFADIYCPTCHELLAMDGPPLDRLIFFLSSLNYIQYSSLYITEKPPSK